MKVIHSLPEIEILKHTDGIYGILSRNTNDNLVGLLELLDVNTDIISSKDLKIKVKKVRTLEQFLSNSHHVLDYNIATKLTLDLVRQILYLEENKIAFSYLDPQDIIVLNNDIFLILNQSNMYSIEDNKIVINKPYDISAFMAPKIKTNTVLPLKIYFTEVYYSIGVLLVYCLFNKMIEGRTELRKALGPIYATRLYWFIDKCLIKEPHKRRLMFF
tara:strand:+ start:337 stop:984 length:648 start_codon:yes stop_codon:yes gene_type:complete